MIVGLPLSVRSKVINSTRDLADASGNVSYTGVGFKPSVIIAFTCVGSAVGPLSIGSSDRDMTESCVHMTRTTLQTNEANGLIQANIDATNAQVATVFSYDSDGFTLAWVKSLLPTGILQMRFLCLG